MTSDDMFHDKSKGAPFERTLVVSDRDVRAAKRLLGLLTEGDRSLMGQAPSRPVGDLNPDALLRRARIEFENRRRRAQFFGPSLFGEPAWDMLLALYLQSSFGPRLTAGRILQFSGSSASTGKRWLEVLADHRFIERDTHPTDGRTYFVRLTEKGRSALEAYLSETVDIGD